MNFEKQESSAFEKVDRKSPEVIEALKDAPVYKKFGMVKARIAQPGEKITTTLASGQKETENVANEGDYIMTNPGGESYIISEQKFLSRYESTKEDGVFGAKGFCKAVKNPYGKPVEIMASWGAPQTGDENALFADVCDESGNMSGEPYIIEGKAFEDTYRLYQPDSEVSK
jgi:hypothetical protein